MVMRSALLELAHVGCNDRDTFDRAPRYGFSGAVARQINPEAVVRYHGLLRVPSAVPESVDVAFG